MKKILFLLTMSYYCHTGNTFSLKNAEPIEIVVENKTGNPIYLTMKKMDHIPLDHDVAISLDVKPNSDLMIKHGYSASFPLRILKKHHRKRFIVTKTQNEPDNLIVSVYDNE